MALAPRIASGVLFLLRTSAGRSRCTDRNTTRALTMSNNDSKPTAFHQFSATEFARLSPSMKVTLLIISRAQLSSRKAIAATAEWKRRCGDSSTSLDRPRWSSDTEESRERSRMNSAWVLRKRHRTPWRRPDAICPAQTGCHNGMAIRTQGNGRVSPGRPSRLAGSSDRSALARE